MRFVLTVNMPSRNGNTTHNVCGEHPAKSLEEIAAELTDKGFIIVEEMYRDDGPAKWKSHGDIMLSAQVIAKIRLAT